MVLLKILTRTPSFQMASSLDALSPLLVVSSEVEPFFWFGLPRADSQPVQPSLLPLYFVIISATPLTANGNHRCRDPTRISHPCTCHSSTGSLKIAFGCVNTCWTSRWRQLYAGHPWCDGTFKCFECGFLVAFEDDSLVPAPGLSGSFEQSWDRRASSDPMSKGRCLKWGFACPCVSGLLFTVSHWAPCNEHSADTSCVWYVCYNMNSAFLCTGCIHCTKSSGCRRFFLLRWDLLEKPCGVAGGTCTSWLRLELLLSDSESIAVVWVLQLVDSDSLFSFVFRALGLSIQTWNANTTLCNRNPGALAALAMLRAECVVDEQLKYRFS